MIYNGSSEGVSSISNAISMFLFNTALMKIAGKWNSSIFYNKLYSSSRLYGVVWNIRWNKTNNKL